MKGVQPKLISKQMMDKPTASSAILHFITNKLKHSSLARLTPQLVLRRAKKHKTFFHSSVQAVNEVSWLLNPPNPHLYKSIFVK